MAKLNFHQELRRVNNHMANALQVMGCVALVLSGVGRVGVGRVWVLGGVGFK